MFIKGFEEETQMIETSLTELEDMDLTTVLGSEELTTQYQIQMLAKHGKTMIMMFKATGEKRYLKQAQLDYKRAKSLQDSGFIRPMGVLLAA